MNLSEEKKTPLRDKDLNKKREMVIQYISTASKTVSIFWGGTSFMYCSQTFEHWSFQ